MCKKNKMEKVLKELTKYTFFEKMSKKFGKTVDLRISVIPAVNGENIVIRILDQNKMSLDISMLGFSKENEELFKKLIRRPQGMILLTGPTGSGKTLIARTLAKILNVFL